MNDLKQREKLIYEIFLKADNEKKIAKFSNNFLYFYKSDIRCWVMLTSVLKALIKNPFYKNFDIIFMGNEKNCQNIIYFFFNFLINTLFNWILKECS